MRAVRRAIVLSVLVGLGGCASIAPRDRLPASTLASPSVAASAGEPPCTAPSGRATPTGWCNWSPDVRALVDDADTCVHFRGEPWPSGDTAPERERRREIVEGIRTSCAGLAARRTGLQSRHAGDTALLAVLSGLDLGDD